MRLRLAGLLSATQPTQAIELYQEALAIDPLRLGVNAAIGGVYVAMAQAATDAPRVRVALPLGGLEVETKLARFVCRLIERPVDFRERPVNMSIVSRISGELSLQRRHGRNGEFRLVCGNCVVVETRDLCRIGGAEEAGNGTGSPTIAQSKSTRPLKNRRSRYTT